MLLCSRIGWQRWWNELGEDLFLPGELFLRISTAASRPERPEETTNAKVSLNMFVK